MKIVRHLPTTAALIAAMPIVMALPAQKGAKMDNASPELAKPFAQFSLSAQSLRDSVVTVAMQQLGVRYRLGAKSPDRGFDCSGLVQFVMDHFHIELPRTSREQAKVGTPLPRDIAALKPGDLLSFGKGRTISHVGIYIGNGKFVHANTPGGRVKEETLRYTTWWKGARRIIAPNAPAVVATPDSAKTTRS